MFLLENFIQAIAFTLDSLLSIYFWIVLISALLSWVNPDPRNPIVRFLYSVTEPVLYHIRRRLPFVVAGGLDLSPLVLMIGIQFAKMLVVKSLYDLSLRVSGMPGMPLTRSDRSYRLFTTSIFANWMPIMRTSGDRSRPPATTNGRRRRMWYSTGSVTL